MAINEETLNATVVALRNKIREKSTDLASMGEVLSSLKSIKKSETGEMPTDRDTGEKMTDARRQEIYDKCNPKAEVYL
ncbi:MAG: hypothetical protein V3V41_00195 [Candidatus Heimdallarchaeota archaeon]